MNSRSDFDTNVSRALTAHDARPRDTGHWSFQTGDHLTQKLDRQPGWEQLCIHSWMSRRRKRQCFPIFDAGNPPTRASLYTVDLGTRRKRGTSIIVNISPSVDGVPFGWNIVDAETSLFIVKRLSALPIENLSHHRC